MTRSLAIALDLIDRGIMPVPVPIGRKGPVIPEWQHLNLTRENAGQYFNGVQLNVGAIMGPKSGGLADADLDCPEAVTLARHFLPATNSIYGRTSKRQSHYHYKCSDPDPKATIQLKDENKAVIVELRLGGGGKGAQSLMPGSKHDTGELYEWDEDGEPGQVTCGELKTAATKIAVATILMRHWPAEGGRHDGLLTIGGFLARASWSTNDIVHLVESICHARGDSSDIQHGVGRTLRDSAERHATGGQEVRGLPQLKELIGEAAALQVAKLVNYQEAAARSSELEEMNEQYCLVPISGKVRILTWETVPRLDGSKREMMTLFGAADFKLLLDNQTVVVGNQVKGLGTWWLRHKDRRQYKGLLFRPGTGSVIDGYLNLWRGFGVVPRPGQWPLMRRHIKEVLAAGNEEQDKYIMNWSGWTVQNPGLPAEVALVFRGGRGTGKGIFGRALTRGFGQHGLHISNMEQLAGRFNAHLVDCALLFADEAYWPGDKSAEGTVKRLITEPTLSIEPKHLAVIQVDNSLHVIMAANAEWVVPAGIDERRFAVFAVSERHKGDKKYFEPLYAELANGGLEAMIHDLLAMDLRGWHPRNDVPQTAALLEQKIASLDDKQAWWYDLLCRGELPKAAADGNRFKCPSVWLYNNYLARTERTGVRRRSTQTALGMFLTKMLGNKLTRTRDSYSFPPLKECRRAFGSMIAAKVQWEEPEATWSASTSSEDERPF